MRRSVTCSAADNSPAGIFQDVSFALTSSSSDNRPSPTRRSAARAATGLLIDAAWNSVCGVTAAPAPASTTPYPRDHSTAPPLITAMLTPGV